MFPLFPTLASDYDDDWLDPPMRERLALGRGRWHLAQVLAFEQTPKHLLRLGRGGFDLARVFPEARHTRHARGTTRPVGPDVVWCDFALGSAPEPARAIAEVWELVPDDGLVAVVDLYAARSGRTERELLESFELRVSPGLLAGLRVAFSPIHTSVLDHQGGAWQSVVMIGRKRSTG